MYIGWKRPVDGWVKLNSDGACKGNREFAGCDRLFRQADGKCIKGFSCKIGSCEALHAETCGGSI